MKHPYIFLCSFFLVAAIASWFAPGPVHAPAIVQQPSSDAIYPQASVTIGGKAFKALVSSTEALRDKGLGQRDSLPADEVMLFVFDKSDLVGFWMKDMKFSIDMVWVDADKTIVSIQNSVSPDTYPKVYFPSRPALYVVETNSGVIKNLGIKVGDTISIDQK